MSSGEGTEETRTVIVRRSRVEGDKSSNSGLVQELSTNGRDRDLRLEEVIECVCVMMTCCYFSSPPPQEMSKEASECAPVPLDSEDPLFMLYTSGSTGKPKGILHTQAGYLLMAGLTQQVHTHTYSSSSCSLSSTLSMCLTIILRMYLHVWQTLVGSLVTPMLCMVHSVMEGPLYCLRALLCTLIPVSSN